MRRHDCDKWLSEGLGCAACSPHAGAIRNYWNDPIRRERDRLRKQVERLKLKLAAVTPFARRTP